MTAAAFLDTAFRTFEGVTAGLMGSRATTINPSIPRPQQESGPKRHVPALEMPSIAVGGGIGVGV